MKRLFTILKQKLNSKIIAISTAVLNTATILKQKLDSKKIAISTAVLATATTVPAFAEVTDPTLTFNFDPAEMFTWTNTMLSALMPVLYITLGISLAFIIINALKYAFR